MFYTLYKDLGSHKTSPKHLRSFLTKDAVYFVNELFFFFNSSDLLYP